MFNSNYLFATGKLRVLETKLADYNDLIRMIEAPDAESAIKVLNDIPFSGNLNNITDEKSLEEFLNSNLKETRDLIFSIVPNNEDLKLLLFFADIHNLKLLFKVKYFNLKTELSNQLFSDSGNFSIEALNDVVINENYSSIDNLPRKNKKFLQIIKDTEEYIKKNKLHEKNKPVEMEYFLDNQGFDYLYNEIKRTKNKFWLEYLKTEIDLANLRIFIRSKQFDKDVKFIENKLAKNGHILVGKFITLYDSNEINALSELTFYLHDHKLKKQIIDNFESKDTFWKLEKAVDEFKIRKLKESKYIAAGLEVVLYYFYLNKYLTRNIRMIIDAKMAGIPMEDIKAHTRIIH